ncbi:MAG: hypothetical protein HGA47_15145 [Zoogloea sp.]|nr:hypothetical protein [Zoogloea sp.]
MGIALLSVVSCSANHSTIALHFADMPQFPGRHQDGGGAGWIFSALILSGKHLLQCSMVIVFRLTETPNSSEIAA